MNHQRFHFWYISVFFLILSPVIVHTQHQLSLAEAIQLGLHNNFQIQIAEKQIEIAENNNTLSATGRYPTIDLNLNSQNGYFNQKAGISFLSGNYYSLNGGITASIDLQWTLFDGFRARISKQRFEELERQSQGNAAIAVEDAIHQIVRTYYLALIERERLDVLKDAIGLSRTGVEFQQYRRQFGQAGDYDILQSQDALLNDSINLILQETVYQNALRNLSLAIGEKDINKKYTLTDTLLYRAEIYDFNTLSRKMLTNNKILNQMLVSRNMARVDLDIQESYRYPVIGLGSGLVQNFDISKSNALNPDTKEEYGAVPSRTFNYYLNFTASYNLFDAGQRKRAIENAKVREMIAELSMEDLQRQLNVQLMNMLETYEKQRQLISITNELMKNSRKNLELADQRLRAGQINSLDYRTIQLSYINAQQARINAIFNLKNTETELTRLTGGFVRS